LTSEEALQQNSKTIAEAKQWIEAHQDERLKFFIIHQDQLPKKFAGVGFARKIAMDEAVSRLNQIDRKNGIITGFDADSTCDDKEIEMFRRLKAEFPKNVGLVVQAYLKRTLDDLKNMMDLQNGTPLNYRLCKGIYVEPAEIAYKKYEEINEHFIEDLDFMFQNEVYPGIATHDKPLVDGAYKLIEKYNVPKEKYEFQMLYGVTPELRKSIVAKGHNMRVYVPFGKDWFGYSTRRLKENPKMAMLIIKALFCRG
jgi:proline dehydrogenase